MALHRHLSGGDYKPNFILVEVFELLKIGFSSIFFFT
jgi:hypothetical protein